jgi:hypothetical protein
MRAFSFERKKKANLGEEGNYMAKGGSVHRSLFLI